MASKTQDETVQKPQEEPSERRILLPGQRCTEPSSYTAQAVELWTPGGLIIVPAASRSQVPGTLLPVVAGGSVPGEEALAVPGSIPDAPSRTGEFDWLVEKFAEARSREKECLILQMRVAWEIKNFKPKAQDGRTHKDTQGEGRTPYIIQAAERLGTSSGTLYKLAKLYETFFPETFHVDVNRLLEVARIDPLLILADYEAALTAPDPSQAIKDIAEGRRSEPRGGVANAKVGRVRAFSATDVVRDLWRDGLTREASLTYDPNDPLPYLIQGDCLKIMAESPCRIPLGSVRALISDGPFGIAHNTRYRKVLPNTKVIANDHTLKGACDFHRKALLGVKPLLMPDADCFLFCDSDPDYLCAFKKMIEEVGLKVYAFIPNIYRKNNGRGDPRTVGGCTMTIIHCGRGETKLNAPYRYQDYFIDPPRHTSRRPTIERSHPHVKPDELMDWLVNLCSSPGDPILDLTAGSGSTVLAALRCDRLGLGIEIDPYYALMNDKRLRNFEADLAAREGAAAVAALRNRHIRWLNGGGSH